MSRLELWQSRGSTREGSVRVAGGSDRKCTVSSPTVGYPSCPPRKPVTPPHQLAWLPHTVGPSQGHCVSNWAVPGRPPGPRPSAPASPRSLRWALEAPDAAQECWLALWEQGPPGGGAHRGPNQCLAYRPKRRTLWKGPRGLCGVLRAVRRGSGLMSGLGHWAWRPQFLA